MPTAEREPRFLYDARPASGAARALAEGCWVVQAERCRVSVELTLADTAAEIHFNLGPSGRHVVGAAEAAGAPPGRQPAHRAAWVVGPRAGSLVVAKETADCDVVGVRLRPGAVARALGVPATELAGALVDLDRLWPRAAVEEIRERLAATADPAARIAVVERALVARLAAGRMPAEDARVHALCAALDAPEPPSVRALAAAAGLSHRATIALFDRHVGLKPRAYHRVARLRRAIVALASPSGGSWARIAAGAGYCDQAHLIHEFRALAGVTPGAYAAARTSVGHGCMPYAAAGA